MASKVIRLDPLPAASDPALLMRAMQAVASGTRDLDGLSDALQIPVPSVQSYLDAGVWLGLLAPGAELRLTPRGLTLTSVDPRRRRRLLAQAIWHTPDAANILRGSGPVLASGRVTAWLREHHPNLSEARLNRLAEAAASLLAPALEFPKERRTHADQLALPFQAPRASAPEEEGPAHEADVRARVVEALLDEGELTLEQASARCDGPAGGVVEPLLRAGLAERVGESIVVTAALAGGVGGAPSTPSRTFLECLDVAGLGLAFPSSLATLSGGLSAVNAGLREAREPTGGRLLRATDTRQRVHGGLLHPGERSLRVIPDGLSLRLRALQCTPAFALLGATLLLERRVGGRLSLRSDGSALRWRRTLIGALGETMTAFARAQGWIVARPERPLLTDESWVEAASGIGLCSRAETRLVMDEALFVRLNDDVEANLILDALNPLAGRLERWLEAQRKERGERAD